MSRLPYLQLCRHVTALRSLNSLPICNGGKKYSSASCDTSHFLSIPSNYSTVNFRQKSTSSAQKFLTHTRSKRLTFSQPKRAFLSQVSHTGFNDYDIGRKEFKLQVPENFNFANVLDDWARKERVGKRTDNIPALWWVDSDGNEIKWNFQDLEHKSKKVANILEQSCGVKHGDIVMVILPRVPEWWLLNIACLRTGAILIPGTTMLTARDIQERVQASKTSVIVTDDKLAPLVDQVANDCKSLTSKLLVSQSGASRNGWENYMNLFESASETHICADTKSDEPMQVFFTSGTTGKPKMAEHTHASYGLGHVITGKFWLDLTSTDVHWNMSDTGWAKSAWSNFYAPWSQGSCVFIHFASKFDVTETLEFSQNWRVLKAKVISDGECATMGTRADISVCDGTRKYWLDLTTSDVFWCMSDTGWAKAAYSNIFGPWSQGACVFILHSAKFDAQETLEVLHKYPISTLCAPPTAYRIMIQEDISPYDLKSIRHTLSAGEPLNPEVVEDWKRRTGCIIREGYGQTETTLLIGSFLCIKHQPGSMGKPAPGYDIRIVDDEGKELGVDEEGYIGVKVKPERPVGLFTKYVNDPDRTASSFVGDYYFTGDKATMDSDGYLWFVGRGDDVITSAGYRIGPFEVESALIEHPAVAESAVVSSPDKVRGEVVKAFVVLTRDYQDHDKATLVSELQEHVKNITAPYKYPRKIEFVETLPKTISGKIRRVELRKREWEGHT